MLMSGNPDNNNSSSCSLKMAISLDKEISFVKIIINSDSPSGDDVVETLEESLQLLPDGSSHLHLTHELDVVLLVLIRHLEKKNVGEMFTTIKSLTMTSLPLAIKSLTSVTPNSWISVENVRSYPRSATWRQNNVR